MRRCDPKGVTRLFINRFLTSQLRINMASGTATTILNVFVTAIGYPAYLYFLGYEKYGVWLVLSTVMNFAQLTNLGIGPAVMKLVAEAKGKGNTRQIEQYVTTAIACLSVSGIIALTIILLFKYDIISLFKLTDGDADVAERLLPYVGVLTIYVFIVQAFNAGLSGLGRMDLSNYSTIIGRVVALLVSILFLSGGYGVVSLLIGSAFSYLFINVLTLSLLHRLGDFVFLKKSNIKKESFRRLLSFGGDMFGSSIVSMLLSPFNRLIISRYVGVSSVPVYEIAFNGAMQVRSLFEAGFRAIAPEVSRLSAKSGNELFHEIRRINRRAVRLAWGIGLPLWAFLIILISPLLKIWLGVRFIEVMSPVFRIMLFGTFISLLSCPAFYILIGLGLTKHILIGNILQSCINAILISALIVLGIKVTLVNISVAVILGMAGGASYLIWKMQGAITVGEA